jgi:hypothetical protein
MYLSTLRSYVEAVGGKLELIVKLPRRPAIRMDHLGDVTADRKRERPVTAATHPLAPSVEPRDTLTDLHYEYLGQRFRPRDESDQHLLLFVAPARISGVGQASLGKHSIINMASSGRSARLRSKYNRQAPRPRS